MSEKPYESIDCIGSYDCDCGVCAEFVIKCDSSNNKKYFFVILDKKEDKMLFYEAPSKAYLGVRTKAKRFPVLSQASKAPCSVHLQSLISVLAVESHDYSCQICGLVAEAFKVFGLPLRG